MTRGKKKESLTPEERLQAALVPESEQPYKVPENWCWVRVSSVCEFVRGITFPASAKEKEPTNTNIPCLRTANVQDELEIDDLIYVAKTYMKGNKAKLVQKDDIIMSSANSRELVGKTSYVYAVPFPMTFGGFVLTIRAKTIISKYLFYFLRLEFLSGHFMGESTQTTNIANINTTKLGEYALPLPPLAEQQRIVDRIESLFAKLDEAKQKAQEALDSFETRKAAILHKAFTGELTAQWRKEHGVGMESWQTKKYSEICNIVRGGSPRPAGSPEFYGGNIPFMKVADITRNTGPYVNSTEYTIKEAGLKKTRMVDRNTLLLTNSGATLGVPAICTFKTTFNDGIAAFLGLNPDTLLFHYYFWTSKTAALRAINKGAAQPNLNTDIIGNVEISLPRENEQREIVRILDNLLAKEQQAKEAAEGVLEQIDLIKKAILARAFRGELGTNDPTEESAAELLCSWD
jgi:type I restriction enzyme stySJI specificity protein